MIRRLLSTLLTRVTTDVDALRAENAQLRWARDHHESEALALARMHAAAIEERDRLRVIAGNTGPTAAERAVLDVVATMPGALAKDIGRAVWQAQADKARAEHGDRPVHEYTWFTREPYDSDITDAVKPLSALYRKGLVHREKAGPTYRYWPKKAPHG